MPKPPIPSICGLNPNPWDSPSLVQVTCTQDQFRLRVGLGFGGALSFIYQLSVRRQQQRLEILTTTIHCNLQVANQFSSGHNYLFATYPLHCSAITKRLLKDTQLTVSVSHSELL